MARSSGGTVQGIGGALWEHLVHDDQGQLLTGTFMEYAMPKAANVPPIEVVSLCTPSPFTPLGMKGVGEGGAIAPGACLANAVSDALAPLGVAVDRHADDPGGRPAADPRGIAVTPALVTNARFASRLDTIAGASDARKAS